ncbi:MAG: hypothetical protein KatS3mg056_2820 [Chloroflexus sp.]|nr:MAG: hypothetical protein KatS3mg056_2820 [Chloroflexus sp.]
MYVLWVQKFQGRCDGVGRGVIRIVIINITKPLLLMLPT